MQAEQGSPERRVAPLLGLARFLPRPPPELGRDRKAERLRPVCSAPAFPLRRAPQKEAARLGAGLGPSAENQTGRDSG